MKKPLIVILIPIALYLFLIQTNFLSDIFFNIGYESYQKAKVYMGGIPQNIHIKTADKYLSWSVRLDPRNFKKAYCYADNLNIIYSDLDPHKLKARELFKNAFKLNPNSDTVAYNIGHLYIVGTIEEYQNIDSALKYFNFAISLNENYYAALESRDWIYQFRLHDYPKAITELKYLISNYENITDSNQRWQPSWAKKSPKQELLDKLNWCYDDLRQINKKKYELTNDYISECSDMDSYNLGYAYATDQLGGGLLADCDYLYRIAVTQKENIDHYCFCMGVSKWLNDNNR